MTSLTLPYPWCVSEHTHILELDRIELNTGYHKTEVESRSVPQR